VHFQRLQGGSWDDAQFANGAEAMSAVLELVRRHKARQPAPLLMAADGAAPAMHPWLPRAHTHAALTCSGRSCRRLNPGCSCVRNVQMM